MKISIQKLELVLVWHKPSVGYEWEDCQPCSVWGESFESLPEKERWYRDIPDGPFLTELDYSQSMAKWEPVEDVALFARFADIKSGPEFFVKWANEYGRLSDIEADMGNDIFLLSKNAIIGKDSLYSQENANVFETDGQSYRRVKADPYNFWYREHRELSFAVTLWEMWANKDPRLNGIVEWAHEGRRIYVYRFEKERLGEIDFERLRTDESYLLKNTTGRDLLSDTRDPKTAWISRQCNYPDALRAILIYLQLKINRKMYEWPIHVAFEMDDRDRLRKKLELSSLLSAMWFQFYLALNGEIRLRRCSLCGQWESMEGHRKNWSKHANCANRERVKRSRSKNDGLNLS